MMENNAHKVMDAKYERFAEQFNNLKNDLIKRYLKSTEKNFELQSEAEDFYINHVSSFNIGLEFDNAGLVAFTAFNRCNASIPANKDLWKEGIKYVAINSNSIDEKKINKLEIEEIASILVQYIDDGNKLADGEDANLDTQKALKEKKGGSIPIEICRTVSDLTEFVSKLEDPSINGLCKYLHNSAKQNHESGLKNVWAHALEKMEGIRGYAFALASNFIKDLMLWWVSSDGKTLQEIRNDVIGNTNKPDIHVKRMLCLILQPQLFDELSNDNKNYNNFKESDTERILSLCGESEWESYYYKKVSSLCDKAGICPLELDRVLYGLMSGNFSEFGEQVTINPPNLAELEIILKKPK